MYADEYRPGDPAEEWRTVAHAGSEWTVSSQGRVRTQVHGGITRGTLIGGYLSVKSRATGVSVAVHRLVALAFCPPGRPEQRVVNHKDGVKTNNAAANLEWATQRENVQHASDTGLIKRRMAPVLRTLADGTSEHYPSIAEASRRTGVNAFEICGACKGRKNRAGGHRWQYVGAADLPAAVPPEEMDAYVEEILQW